MNCLLRDIFGGPDRARTAKLVPARRTALNVSPVVLLVAAVLTAVPAYTQTLCTQNMSWGVTGNPVPGIGYGAYDWRGMQSATLPQTIRYFFNYNEDLVDLTIEDGTRAAVAPNEVVIVLNSSAQVTWAKEVALWNLENGIVSRVGTKDANHGPSTIRVRRSGCPFETVVFRKAKMFGVVTDVYHIDPTNFWRLYGGKILTFTWQSDDGRNPSGAWPIVGCGNSWVDHFWFACLPYDFAARTPATKLVGDFNGDKKSDIALLGPPGWNTVPVAFSNGDGSFRVTNLGAEYFPTLASERAAKILTGDFNGDGKTDIALTGPGRWNTVPVAFSNGDGTFRITNYQAGLLSWGAAQPGVRVLTGDFNRDGKTDVALTGVVGWNTIVLGLSNGDGTFNVINAPVGDLGSVAAIPGIQVLTGDLDGDGTTDIAFVGGAGWTTVPVLFSTGGGFRVGGLNTSTWSFAQWAADSQAQAFIGDFDGNGRADIALIGPAAWASVPIAYSWGDGSFYVVNQDTSFAKTAARWGSQVLIGDFNGDRHLDILQAGGNEYAWIPIGFGASGSLNFTSASITADFNKWVASPWAVALAGDFNGDGKTDIAVTGTSGWSSLPVAFSNGDGTFIVTNRAIQDFATLASKECGTILPF